MAATKTKTKTAKKADPIEELREELFCKIEDLESEVYDLRCQIDNLEFELGDVRNSVSV